MAKLDGKAPITNLPANRGLIVKLWFYEVAGPDVPAPYDADPPADAATDCRKIVEHTSACRMNPKWRHLSSPFHRALLAW
jgi:hypothetical protein